MDDYAATIGAIPEWNSKMLGRSQKCRTILLMIALPVLLCISLLLILMLSSNFQQHQAATKCSPSAESKRSNLTDVLKEIQHLYFHDLNKEVIYRKPGVTHEDIRSVFRPYDPRPSAIRYRTQRSANILRQLNALKIDTTLLKMRERKALHVARAILRNNFGWMPYTQNYNIGDWMLGPDMFCWQPICLVFLNLNAVISHFKPYNMKDLKTLKVLFEQHNETFERYIENLKQGVRSGYVRTYDACKTGLHNLHYVYYRTVAVNNETGVYEEPFSATLLNSSFFEHLSTDDNETWARLYGVDVTTFFNRSLLTNIARPALKMLRYLENEHLRNCVPATIASGLGSLPLRYSYTDGIADTSKYALNVLPTGEKLVGKQTYEALMSYFTTINIKPAKLREKAVERLELLYNEAVEIAKSYTKEEDNNTATENFSKEIQAFDMWFNNEPFPSNESGDVAFIKCFDFESAKAFCPERWRAMETWIQNTVETMKLIRPTIKAMFYETGPKNTVPVCPIDVVPWFHPHGVFHSYLPGSKDCSFKATQGLPFFTENYGPKWTEYTTTAHEQLPGHHLEVMSYTEYFEDDCGDAITWMGSANYFPAITEGWATYVEYKLLGQDTKLYKNTSDKKILRQKYGMIYYQILAALRAIVDIDLNYNGKTKEDAVRMYKQYVWEDNSQQVQKDITRIQSTPGIVTSYMIGEMEISRVRNMTEQELGADFSLEDFHYQVLRQGEYPLDYLEEHLKAYIACKKDPTKAGCKEMLQ